MYANQSWLGLAAALSMTLAYSATAAAQICTPGERRERANVVIAEAFSEQCWSNCERVSDKKTYNAPPGWAILRYWTGTRHDRGRTTRSVEHATAKSALTLQEELREARSQVGRVEAVDPNTGQPIAIGGSTAARRAEQLLLQRATTHTTVLLTVTAIGREFRGGSSRREEALHVEEMCIGTVDDYRRALLDEVAAARRR
jgi:hypothetical protein